MNREGIKLFSGMLVLTAGFTAGAMVTAHLFFKILAIAGVLLTAFVMAFFRDPERTIPEEANLVVSPADGKIIEIVDEEEQDFIGAPTTRVSIFLSIFDVHINRIPISGRVAYLKYRPGAFLQAFKKEASLKNEQTIIGIENTNTKLLFKQIAGILARRIVCNLKEGDEVKKGMRFGMIKFGSRVDIFLPKNIDLKVRIGQKVQGGTSIIGVINHDS